MVLPVDHLNGGACNADRSCQFSRKFVARLDLSGRLSYSSPLYYSLYCLQMGIA